MFNIDKYVLYLQECKEDIFINLYEKNLNLEEILYIFIKNSNLNAIKYIFEKEIIIDNDNIIYNIQKKKYYYKFKIPIIYNTDIITNIRCNNKIDILYYVNEIECDIKKLTLPIFNIKNSPIFLLILLDKKEITKIVIKYDIYTLNNTIRNTLKNYDIINNENLIFLKEL
jgi:hypothetical protein